jgi:ankyrin repeat protein
MRILILFVILCTLSTAAQTAVTPPAAFELDGTQLRPYPIGLREVIRAADDPLPTSSTALQPAMHSHDRIENNFLSVELSVIVNLNGRIESAKPIRGPERFYAQAQEIEMHRAFEPIHDRDGVIVRAHFTDAVQIAPPEKWSDRPTPFPQPIDRTTFRIALQRTVCYGSCPGYKVSISGTGEVQWEGGPYAVAVPGTHHATLPSKSIDDLIDAVRASRILDARDEYRAGWTDSPTYTLSIDLNGVHKQVVDYIGIIVGMPTSIRDLEDTVDRIAGTDKWIAGNADLLPSLRAEHWDFAASTPDNLRLYNSALQHKNQEVLAAFNAARAPVFSSDLKIPSPACAASATTDSSTVLEMLASVPKDQTIPQHALNQCLMAAAQGGNLQLTEFWLKRGASVIAMPHVYSADSIYLTQGSPLLAAIQGGSPAVVHRLLEAKAPLDSAHNDGRNLVAVAISFTQSNNADDKRAILQELLRAGVNPNEQSDRDPSLFQLLSEPSLVPMLVAGGANPNAMDRNGMTPLMTNVYVPVLKALLKAGADPTLRNKRGQNAAEWFRAEGLKEQADLIDAAIKTHLDGASPTTQH